MTLADPLEPFRVAPAGPADEMYRAIANEGVPTEEWKKGGPYVALTQNALFFVSEGTLYRVRRGQVRGLGLTRATSTKLMRRGLLFYFLGLPMLIILPPYGPVLGIGCAIAGAYFVTKGFTAKALLVQVKDERVPPFVVPHQKWRGLRAALREWEAR